MPRKLLSTSEQIKKLEPMMNIANEAAASDDLVRRIGAVTIYAGIVDFLTIQLVRLIEQVVLKSQFVAGESPKFTPHTSSYFYHRRMDTRKIVNHIKETFLPFRATCAGSASDVAQANILVNTLIEKTNEFLNYRIVIIHHVGSPSVTFQKWNVACDKALYAYNEFLSAHVAFAQAIQPYGFSEKEFQYFDEIQKILRWRP